MANKPHSSDTERAHDSNLIELKSHLASTLNYNALFILHTKRLQVFWVSILRCFRDKVSWCVHAMENRK